MSRINSIRRKSGVRCTVLALGWMMVVSGCETGVELAPIPGDGPDIRTDALEYQVGETGGGMMWRLHLPYTYTNRTGRPIGGFGGPVPSVQRFQDDRWVNVSNFATIFPPWRLLFHIGESVSDTLVVTWPVYGRTSGGYELEIPDPSGEFRLVWNGMYFSDFLGRPTGEEVPLEHRMSNVFILDFPVQ